jgi:uncharacterized spore protein YtfJ
MRILEQVKELMVGSTVFGQPYEKNGLTLIPASRVWAGGGGGQASADQEGGGAGIQARPAGAFVITGGEAKWLPSIDANRLIFGAQIVAVIAILRWRAVAKANARPESLRGSPEC